MKTGSVNAVAALLVASGWVAAQAPLPISYDGPRTQAAGQAAPAPPAPAAPSASPAPPTVPAPGGAVKPVGDGVHEQATHLVPVPSDGLVPAGTAGAAPSTHVLPAGGCVDGAAGRASCIWADADFIMWRINNGHVPAVNAQPPVGVLTVRTFDFISLVNGDGSLSTSVQPGEIGYFPLRIQDVPDLPNGGNVNLGASVGGRFALGAWFVPDQLLGLEGRYFFLERRSQLLTNDINNTNNQLLFTTPFSDREFTVTPGQGDTPPTRTQTGTLPIFFVRQLDSALTAGLSNSMWGGEINFRSTCCYFGPVAIGGLVGFRHLEFTEDLDVNGTFSLTTPATVAPATDAFGNLRPDNLPATVLIRTRDTVAAKNHFYGGNIGSQLDAEVCGFFLNLRTQVAMGGMHQRVDVDASTNTATSATSQQPASTTTTTGGLLFNQIDNGAHKRERISFIPELNLRAGYQFSSWLRGYVGYDIMYISNVVRPGDVSAPLATSSTLQSSTAPSSVSGAPAGGAGVTNLTVNQSSFRFSDSNVWTQGFSFGVELSY